MELQKSINASKDPLHLAFLKSKEPTKTSQPPAAAVPEVDSKFPTVQTDIGSCLPTNNMSKQLSFFGKLASAIREYFGAEAEVINSMDFVNPALTEVSKVQQGPRAPRILRDCIKASMTRAPGNEGFTCDYPTAKEAKRGFNTKTQSVPVSYGKASGKTLQCVTDDMVDYMDFAVNSAIQCMSPADPIDSRVIYKKLNNETAFNLSMANRGGVGVGQLTTPAIKELTDEDLGKGRYILENIVNSKKPECKPFKDVAKASLKKRPHVNSTCDWASAGDGLARSLIHSIGYYLVMRDNYVIPALEKRNTKLLTNPSLISDLTAISYGAEGWDHARWLLQKYRVNEKTSPKSLQTSIRQDSVYLGNISDKMHDVTCIRNGMTPQTAPCDAAPQTAAEAEADTCVQK